MNAHLDGIGRIVAAASGDHRNALFCGRYRALNHFFMLIIRERWGLAGRAADDDGVRPLLNMPFNQCRQFVEIDRVFPGKRRDNRHPGACKNRHNCFLPLGLFAHCFFCLLPRRNISQNDKRKKSVNRNSLRESEMM